MRFKVKVKVKRTHSSCEHNSVRSSSVNLSPNMSSHSIHEYSFISEAAAVGFRV